MGSSPTQKLELDVNGTGVLVDVTNMTLMDAGLHHAIGRSSWTAAEPAPGSLSFTLDNVGGRFTPGHTTALGGLYTVGCRPGIAVKWTCGARIRLFTITAVELLFATGAPGGSQVAVSCLDVLGRMATRTLGTMLAEHIMASHPRVYYPLTEAAPADGSTLVQVGADVSGNNRQPLTPTGNPADELAWGNGVGPRLDGHSCVSLRMSATTPAVEGDRFRYEPTGLNGGPLRVTPRPRNVDTTIYRAGPNTPQDFAVAVSFWFSIKDIYGPTSGDAGTTDGPYVHLLRLEGGWPGFDPPPVSILWRIADRRLLLAVNLTQRVVELSNATYSVAPTAVHHLHLTIRSGGAAPWPLTLQAAVDGVTLASNTVNIGLPYYPADNPVNGVGWGTDAAMYGLSADRTVYELAGTIAHIAAYGPPDVTIGSTTGTVPAAMARAGYAADQWAIGQSGTLETAAARFLRLGSYLDADTFDTAGASQPAMRLGSQDTEGKSLLSAVCTALAAEGRQVEATTAAGVGRVRTQLDSAQRQLTPRFTIDVDRDGVGAPGLAFDQSGAVSTATANGSSKATASWTVDPDLVFGETRSVTIDSALPDQAALLVLAQDRTTQGRFDTVAPSSVTVNATVSTTALTAALLNDLRAGDTIALTGLPAAVIGYATQSCTVVGVSESHTLDGSVFTIALQPFTANTYLDSTERLAWGAGFATVADGGSQLLSGAGATAVNATDTTLQVWTPVDALLTADPADFPLYLRCDQETMQLTSPPVLSGAQIQTLTGVIRGGLGTAAAAHNPPGTRSTYFVDTAGTRIPDPYIAL